MPGSYGGRAIEVQLLLSVFSCAAWLILHIQPRVVSDEAAQGVTAAQATRRVGRRCRCRAQVTKFSNVKRDAAEQLLGFYDAALGFLRAHGALLNAVKPEMLLDREDFERCGL